VADAAADGTCWSGAAVVHLLALVTGIEFDAASLGWWERLPFGSFNPS
jgi:hypothetical protein